MNKVTIDVKSKDGAYYASLIIIYTSHSKGTTTKKKSYDLNTQSDPFYNKYCGVPFPEAVEANEKELAEVIFLAAVSNFN